MTTLHSSWTARGTADRARPFFWEEATKEWHAARSEGRHADFPEYVTRKLRAVREGVGREAGTVASMRTIHRIFLPDSEPERLPASYLAEHYTLTLFGLHQHAASSPAHQAGVGLGTACLRLQQSQALTGPSVQRRLIAAATAQDMHELAQHLQRLVPLLRQASTGVDYTRLFHEMTQWDGPGRNRALRAWGLQYTDPGEEEGDRAGEAPAPYWVTFVPGSRDAGAELAALRSGTGQEAGTVAAMWPFHRTRMGSELRHRGSLTRDLAAEHTALTLFARHQQTHAHPMHLPGASPGTATGLLARKAAAGSEGKSATASLERRFGVLLTSGDCDELAAHLRSLIPLLNRASIELDYDLLRSALRVWDDPHRPHAASRFRQQWDRDFHRAVTS